MFSEQYGTLPSIGTTASTSTPPSPDSPSALNSSCSTASATNTPPGLVTPISPARAPNRGSTYELFCRRPISRTGELMVGSGSRVSRYSTGLVLMSNTETGRGV